MNIKLKNIFVAFALATALVSCGNDANTKNKIETSNHEGHDHEKENHDHDSEDAEHEGHDHEEANEKEEHEEGIVKLTTKQQEALGLKLGNFEMRNLTTVVKTNGQLSVPPSATADVTVAIGGNVKKIYVFEGDKVKKGQLLATLQHPNYIALQEDFAQVANQLEFSKKEYERQNELFKNNAGSGKALQQAKAEYFSLKAKQSGLKARLNMLNISTKNIKNGEISNSIKILARISGFINEVNVRVGSFVDSSDKLFTIKDNSQLHADFLIFEKDISKLKIGQKIHFVGSGSPDREFTADIFAIGKEFETNSRSVKVHANIDGDKTYLIPGMYVSGHLHTDELITRTLPSSAVVSEGTKSYIFILDEDHNEEGRNAFKQIEVVTGRKDDGYTEVKLMDSIPENSKIVTNVAYYLLADMGKEETEHVH